MSSRARRRTRRSSQALTTAVLASVFVATAVVFGIVQPWKAERPYVPGQGVEGITRELDRQAPASAPAVRFTDVAAEAGLDFRHFHGSRSVQLPEDMGSGLAWGDYDGDGDDDLLLVNISGSLEARGAWSSSPASTRLYRNDGGRFTDVTEQMGVGFRGLGMAASWADFDGDGDLDLLVTAYEGIALYRNDGDRFTDVAAEVGLSAEGFFSGAAWADYDRDGDLDLYLCRYVRYRFRPEDAQQQVRQYQAMVPSSLNPSAYEPAPNVLYRNDGGRFTDVTAEAGVANAAGRSLAAVFSDFDSDGWPDLYVANDVSDNALFRNRGDGTFAEISHEAWVADYRGAMGLALGDYDNDGDTDLFVTHWVAQENALYRNLHGELPPDPARGGPAMRFIDEAERLGLGQVALDFIGWGTTFLDYDLDGRLDLFVANGSTFQDSAAPARLVPMRAQLFWNKGPDTGFVEVGAQSGAAFSVPVVGRGSAVSDFDGDGDPDIAVLVHSGAPLLLRNDQQLGRNFLKLRLAGRGANRFAIGARVLLHAGGRLQSRELTAGSSYLSQDSLTLLFGLGDQSVVERLEVRWPDGEIQLFEALEAGRELLLVQGEATPPSPAPPGDERERVRRFWSVFRQATAAKDAGRWDEAIGLFERALLDEPAHETALHFLGTSLFELGRYPEALAVWQRLVAINPRSASGLFQLGNVRSCPEPGAPWDLQRAAAHFEALQALNPDQTGPRARLAEIDLALGRLDEAAARFEQVLGTNHQDTGSFYLLGYVRLRQGRTDEAAALLGKAAEAIRGQSPVRGILGEGDSTAALRTNFPQRRLFAPLWLDLASRGPGTAPSAAQAAEEYARVTEYLAALPPTTPAP
jgi:enediyne biosynthesis protein E4